MSKSLLGADPPDVDLEKGVGTKEPRRENITRDAGHPASQNASSGRDTKLEEDEASPYAQHCRDNAKIWSKYLRETDNEDKEVTSIGNSSLDSMLTFAGLFASVLAAFLIESRKDLAEDPQERLLTELLYALRGTPAPSPPVPFQPTASALAVNTLWFTSLTLTLMSALAGVLAKGWLAQYNPVSRKERMEDAYKRQHRFNMAEIWGLSTVISLIPFGIQVSLFLFFAGLIIQIQDDDLRIRLVVLLLVAIAAILYICWTVSPLFIAEFPFPTPLSRYLRALPWLKKYDWDSSDLLRGLGLLRENVLQVLGQYEPMELQLQILTWGVTSAADEETTDEAIKALSGVKQSSRLREMLYNQEIHNFIRERLQQKFSLSNKSSLTINNTPQIESILLALLRIEKPLHLDGQRNLAISASSNPVMMPPNWEEFRPCLQPLAFSLRIHMLVNASLDDRDELWFQRVDALDRMALNPSTSYVRSILLFAALRGLLQGEKYTRRECGIVFSRLLMTLGSLEEVVGILNSPLETYPNDRGLLDGPELSERIIDLLLCEDTASRCAGARILVVLMSHGKLNSVARRAAENGYIGLFDYSDPDVQLLGIKLFSVLAQDRTMVEYIRNCAPRLVDMFQAERWDVRQAAVIVFGQLSQHESFQDTVKGAIPKLTEAFKDPEIDRQALVGTLQKLAYHEYHQEVKDVAFRLVDMLKDSEPPFRVTVFSAFGKLSQYDWLRDVVKDAIPQFVRTIQDTLESDILNESVATFGQLTGHAWLQAGLKDYLMDVSKDSVNSSWPARQAAVTILGNISHYELIPETLQSIVKDIVSQSVDMLQNSELRLRITALRVFGQLAQHDWLHDTIRGGITQLVALFRDPSWQVREAAVFAFGQLARYDWLRDAVKESTLQLVVMFKDPDSDVVSKVTEIFAHLSKHEWLQDEVKDAIPQLIHFTTDRLWFVRMGTVTALGELIQSEWHWTAIRDVLPQIVNLLKDRDYDVSAAASTTIRHIVKHEPLRRSIEGVIPLLLELIRDGTQQDRMNSARIFNSLAGYGDVHNAVQAHVPLFVTLLVRPDLDIRSELIGVLSKLSTNSSIRVQLQFALSDAFRMNIHQSISDSSAIPPPNGSQVQSHSLQPSRLLTVTEIDKLLDGRDTEKWFISRQSLWKLLYFSRRCEHSFGSVIDIVIKEATPTCIAMLANTYQDEKLMPMTLIKLIKMSGSQSRDISTSIIKMMARLLECYNSDGDFAQYRNQVIGSVEDITMEMTSNPDTRRRRWEAQRESLQNHAKNIVPHVMDILKHGWSDNHQDVVEVLRQTLRNEWARDIARNWVLQMGEMFNHSDWRVREGAVTVFGELARLEWLGDLIGDIIPQFIGLLKDSDSDVRRAAVKVFEELCQHEWLHDAVKLEVSRFVDMFTDSNIDIQKVAIIMFGQLALSESFQETVQSAVEDGVPHLFDMLNHPDPNVRQASVTEFRHLAAREWLREAFKATAPQLKELLKESESRVRLAAVTVCGQLAEYEWLQGTIKDTIPQIVNLFKDSDPDVRHAAVVAFGQLAQHEWFRPMVKDAVHELVDVFGDLISFRTEPASIALEQLVHHGWIQAITERVLPEVLVRLKDSNYIVQSAATKILSQLAQYEWATTAVKDSMPQIMAMLETSGFSGSHIAAIIFEKLSHPPHLQGTVKGTAPQLVKMFKHMEWGTRLAAVTACTQLIQNESFKDMIKDVMPHITEMLKDSDSDVRGTAAKAFGLVVQQEWLRVAVRGTLPQLLAMFKHSAVDVRETVGTAFWSLTQHKSFITDHIICSNTDPDGFSKQLPIALESLCYDQSEEVVSMAARSVGQLAEYGYFSPTFINVTLYSLQELHSPNSTTRPCAATIWTTFLSYASLRPALYEITAIFGGIMYLEPDTSPKDLRASVERMIEHGMLKIYHKH